MKKIIVQRLICQECEDFMKLINYETGEILMAGDYYHDKISQKIDGFIEGLEFAGIIVIEEDYDELSACECVGCC